MRETSFHTLCNGLRVVHTYNPSVASVAVNVAYGVGSRNESPERTGLAHLFEHLMFGGSANVPDYDKVIESAGGTNNAWTGTDSTNFYSVVPGVNVESALWAESDRMLSPNLSTESLAVQRSVVCEEFKETCLNRPYGDLMHHLRGMLYKVHPYRWPTIGLDMAHIRDVSDGEVLDFFNRHYSPDNAVLSVVGNLSFDNCCRLAERYFGDIPGRNIEKYNPTPEPEVQSPREKVVTGSVPYTQIVVAYPMGGVDSPLYPSADLLTDILGMGRNSVLFRNLVRSTDLFAEVDASIIGSDEPGALLIAGVLTDNSSATIDRALQLVDRLVAELADKGVDRNQWLGAYNRWRTRQVEQLDEISQFAETTAQALLRGTTMEDEQARYAATTENTVTEVARSILNPNRKCTLVYTPE